MPKGRQFKVALSSWHSPREQIIDIFIVSEQNLILRITDQEK